MSVYLLASERSERDTYRGNTNENRGCLFIYLFIYMDVRMSFCTLTLRIFVFARRSTPSQIALNRILWFMQIMNLLLKIFNRNCIKICLLNKQDLQYFEIENFLRIKILIALCNAIVLCLFYCFKLT